MKQETILLVDDEKEIIIMRVIGYLVILGS